jgi:hypothetical protein
MFIGTEPQSRILHGQRRRVEQRRIEASQNRSRTIKNTAALTRRSCCAPRKNRLEGRPALEVALTLHMTHRVMSCYAECPERRQISRQGGSNYGSKAQRIRHLALVSQLLQLAD